MRSRLTELKTGIPIAALRDFERVHGLAITPEIGSALVSQLTARLVWEGSGKGLWLVSPTLAHAKKARTLDER